jgi:hypothetical protein
VEIIVGRRRRQFRDFECSHFECRQWREVQQLEVLRDNETNAMHGCS